MKSAAEASYERRQKCFGALFGDDDDEPDKSVESRTAATGPARSEARLETTADTSKDGTQEFLRAALIAQHVAGHTQQIGPIADTAKME